MLRFPPGFETETSERTESLLDDDFVDCGVILRNRRLSVSFVLDVFQDDIVVPRCHEIVSI